MKNVLISLFFVFSAFIISSTVYGEVVCTSDGCFTLSNAKDPGKVNEFLDKLQSSLDSEMTRYETNTSPGFNIGGGIGYAMYLAADVNLFLGYDIVFTKSRDFGFGIYANVHGIIGEPMSLNWSVAPTFLITTGIFRFSLGLGLGTYHFMGLYDYDEISRYSEINSYFMFKPDIKFHWFVEEHFYIGFGIDLSIIFLHTISGKGRDSDTTRVVPWASGYFSLGYKL